MINFKEEKLEIKENNTAKKAEKEALLRNGPYIVFTGTIEMLQQEIASIEDKLAQKYVEIDRIQKLISNNYINNIEDISYTDTRNNQFFILKNELEKECLNLRQKLEKLENKKLSLIKEN